jgi:glyoxylase-like metal-dependent hydrolase (beta-lactamase superfamily II)
MDQLWGEVRGVPQQNLRALEGGERIDVSGRTFEVAYTPGHASHHVSYFDRSSGVAFVGDTAGIRRTGETYVMPPTPPPDIDVEAWLASVDTIEAWRPATIFITHFGPYHDVARHLSELRHQLHENAALVRDILSRGGAEADHIEEFKQTLRRRMLSRMSPSDEERYEIAGAFQYHWYGLARYWKKKEG